VRVLAIDTALEACGAAIVESGHVRALAQEFMAKGQAERLAPMVRDLFAEAGCAPRDVDRIVVTVGPGSFTGVRVGLAFARGLAVALAKQCVGVATLEALALEAGEGGLRGALVTTPGALYAALYRDGAAVLPPQRCERDELANLFAPFAAEGFDLRGPGVADARLPGARCVERAAPDLVALARLGVARDPAIAPPAPLYLRAALA